jgi:hypothetical protein
MLLWCSCVLLLSISSAAVFECMFVCVCVRVHVQDMWQKELNRTRLHGALNQNKRICGRWKLARESEG